ncbi:MAG TPA: FAD-binding protein [Desulfobacteraceae bacterium]|nr:FAD-dependent oxidoreductase [Deltaproteobacteria bacterium]HDI59225.1 FAD-binding protein [Desulfobacteraceae bacterium]
MYRYLFSPITINQLEIKNRIAYPALGLLYSYDSRLNDRYYEYFRARARGGAGIVTVGPVGVDFIGSGLAALSLRDDTYIPDFQKLTGIIRGEGARAFIQLFHAGGYSHPILIDGQTPIGPSAVFNPYAKVTPREMTLEDIDTVQEAFAAAAARAVEAGFDGVEIIASAGYLLTQFLSPLRNQRTDAYGGSFENRVRFPRETIERVRQRIGPDVPLSVRMAGNDFVPGSNTDSETPAIAKVYEAAGVDVINVTGGWHESKVPQLPMELPRSAYAYLALNIKKAVSVPVMASNRITMPETAEQILRDGCADMVNLGRVLIADPEWPRKAFEGRSAEIRPCVACSQGCTDQIFSGKPVFCVGNPLAGFEGERKIFQADPSKRVMVVGAGAAGLEAAVTAAQRGFQVSLYDKAGDIGGQLWLAGAPPHKREILELIRYYRAMLNRLDIRLHLNTAVDLELIRREAPDHVIVAEGAEALVPPIAGIHHPDILTAWQVLGDNPRLGRRVAIIGGGAVGLETALFVAAKGTLTPEILHFLFAYEAERTERLRELMFRGTSEVTVFEMLPKAGADVGKSTKWILLANLDRHGVKIRTNTKVAAVEDGRMLTLDGPDGQTREDFDTVIVASGSRPVQRLSKALEEAGIPYTAVGDTIAPGKLNDAIHGGFLAALAL